MAPSSGIAPAGRALRTPSPDSGEVVLTATLRLARELARAEDVRAIRAGRVSWVRPEIIPFEGWLRRLYWDWLCSGRGQPVTLLPSGLEFVLWEETVQASTEGRELLDVAGIADTARQAWNLLWHWELPGDAPGWSDTEDTEAFQAWSGEFRALLTANGWITAAMLPGFLSERVSAGEVSVPPEVRVVGYDELPPAHGRLLASLGRRGVRIVVEEAASELVSSMARVSFPDSDREVRAAAAWARRRLEEHGPAVSVGIVVPDLGGRRETIERLFREEFDPGSHLNTSRDRRRGFNISLGRPLADYPVVESALQLLRLRPDWISIESARRCLLSRFLHGAEQEHASRALLARMLAAGREPGVSASVLEKLAASACPLLEACLRDWHQLFESLPVSASPGDWAQRSWELLEAFGWPGAFEEGGLDSATHQVRLRWEGLLNSLVELDGILGPVPFGRALSLLDRLAASLQFQPESEPAPIQILGLFEAGGFRFDDVWIMGMDDGAWPRAGEANPFLPAGLQREHGLAGSSPEHDLEYARLLTRRLLSGALRTCVVSHAFGDSEVALGPSPLFRGLAEAQPGELVGAIRPEYSEQVRRSSRVEVIPDPGPVWKVGEAPVRGGTRVLADQAACPFRAFARSRLGAVAREEAHAGLDARDRGSLVHAALERVWSELGSHAGLCAAGDASSGPLAGVVMGAVDGAIDVLARTRAILRSPGFRDIERARLGRLLTEWLELEKRRAPFRVVATEARARIRVGVLTLLTRMDRIDRLPDGTHVLIDYKTRPAGPTLWEGERPADPQLPVYASYLAEDPSDEDHPLSAVCFGVVRTGQARFTGLSASTKTLPGVGVVERPLGETVEGWRATLRGLAEEFRQGRAAVDPRDGATTCRDCDLGPLCRIGERRRIGQEGGPRIDAVG
jgi:ATP-dependent helicase/nuclease subunit B